MTLPFIRLGRVPEDRFVEEVLGVLPCELSPGWDPVYLLPVLLGDAALEPRLVRDREGAVFVLG